MPNHCFNRVEIHCKSKKQAKEIAEFLESEETCFDLNNIVPSPNWSKTPLTGKEKSWVNVDKKYGDVGELPVKDDSFPEAIGEVWKFASTGENDDRWYDWRINNWGTKWNTYDAELLDINESIEYTFNTAWGPPDMAIAALREIYKEERDGVIITAFYDEPGLQMAGYY
ncbi:hypothetical protein [Marinobacter sp.]|uniref:hypothetical protein n=1 Tax=Marinobacter sp. TaxID=50741 RepID=UPI000C8C20D8|nr:hypothetical protein [Marinobacter sp.]MAK50664.1 hypothetical protein [Marinobacter sp.]